jgi:hypothetical protein
VRPGLRWSVEGPQATGAGPICGVRGRGAAAKRRDGRVPDREVEPHHPVAASSRSLERPAGRERDVQSRSTARGRSRDPDDRTRILGRKLRSIPHDESRATW